MNQKLHAVAERFRKTSNSLRDPLTPDGPPVVVAVPHYARPEPFVAKLCDKIAGEHPDDRDVQDLMKRIRSKGNAGAVKDILDEVQFDPALAPVHAEVEMELPADA